MCVKPCLIFNAWTIHLKCKIFQLKDPMMTLYQRTKNKTVCPYKVKCKNKVTLGALMFSLRFIWGGECHRLSSLESLSSQLGTWACFPARKHDARWTFSPNWIIVPKQSADWLTVYNSDRLAKSEACFLSHPIILKANVCCTLGGVRDLTPDQGRTPRTSCHCLAGLTQWEPRQWLLVAHMSYLKEARLSGGTDCQSTDRSYANSHKGAEIMCSWWTSSHFLLIQPEFCNSFPGLLFLSTMCT